MTKGADYSHISAAALGRAMAAGAYDPVDVCGHFLDRIENAEDQTVYITVTAERARAEAEASRRRYKEGRPLGPLDGVPAAWKDLFDIKGTPTTAGSAFYENATPAVCDSAAAANARDAGMVCLGKVNLTEMAFSGLGINPHFGTPRNPHDRQTVRIPGGSSSGSAVAVACGLAPCAVGTDTGGSVRIPAALNGIVGFKTSEGAISKQGVFDLSPTLDTVGPMTRTVEDAVLLDAVMRGELTSGVRRAGLEGLALLIPDNIVFEDVEDDVAANFENCIVKLEKRGARVTRREVPALDEMKALSLAHGSIVSAESYLVHKNIVTGPGSKKIYSRVIDRIMTGEKMSAFDILTVQTKRAHLIREFEAELNEGLMTMPTTVCAAPETAPLEKNAELYRTVNLKMLRNTAIGNFMAACGLTLPSGTDRRGLPTGILFLGPSGTDKNLLSLGLGIESALAGTSP